MMEAISSAPDTPTNLTATVNNNNVDLTWDSVTGATGYEIKRASTPGGPYTTIASSVYNNYTDTNLSPGTCYYVVNAVNAAGDKSANSNEVSATIIPQATTKALLLITMINGIEKEYEMTMSEVDAFITWFNNRASGSGSPTYIVSKNYNKGPFLSRKDYIVFDKILSFEVMEYPNP